jgi:hypothetical protein
MLLYDIMWTGCQKQKGVIPVCYMYVRCIHVDVYHFFLLDGSIALTLSTAALGRMLV